MPEFTRDYCLAKIAELEQKSDLYRDPAAQADYVQMLAGWRWLAARAAERADGSLLSGGEAPEPA